MGDGVRSDVIPEADTFSIRLAFECKPGVTRAEAERAASMIQEWAEQRVAVDHCFEHEVYDVLEVAGDE